MSNTIEMISQIENQIIAKMYTAYSKNSNSLKGRDKF